MKTFNTSTGLVFVACMFIGMGIGYFMGHMVAGMFVGMGLGFAFKAIQYISERERSQAE